MLISQAFAQANSAAPGGNMLTGLLPIVLIFVVFWFLLIRPQQKRMKEHREMVANLKRNDQVVTGGGIIGKVVKVGESNEIEVEIAKDVVVKVDRSSVTAVVPKDGAKRTTAAGQANVDQPKSLLGKLFGGKR